MPDNINTQPNENPEEKINENAIPKELHDFTEFPHLPDFLINIRI